MRNNIEKSVLNLISVAYIMSTVSIPIEFYLNFLDTKSRGQFLVPGEMITLRDMVDTVMKRLPRDDNRMEVILQAVEIITVFHKAILAGQCFTRSDLNQMRSLCQQSQAALMKHASELDQLNSQFGYPDGYIKVELFLGLYYLMLATNDI